MGPKEPELEFETHTLSIPYATIIFGKVYNMPLECVFEYAGDLKKDTHLIEVVSLTGKDDAGMDYDMSFLVEEAESLWTADILAAILKNHSQWDGDAAWWEENRIGLKAA